MPSKKKRISKRQAFYLAFSILVAVGIWIFVDLHDHRTATVVVREIPIEYVGEDEVLAERGLMLMKEGTDASVDLELTGARWDIALLDRSKIRIQVDLKEVTSKGKQNLSYRIIYPDRSFNNIIKVSDANPFSATVNIGELYSRTVGIRCEIQGEIAEGYSAGTLRIAPEELEIRGQKELIDPISYAKVVLDLDHAESTVSEMLSYEFYDEKDHKIENSGIHATEDQVRVTLPVNVTKELKLTMDFQESPGAQMENVKYELHPATITVSGDAAQLEQVDEIVLDEFRLLSLDPSNGTEPQHRSYTIVVPKGCENLSGVTRASLDIAFCDMAQKTMTLSNFHYANKPEGKEIELLTKEIKVAIFGPKAEVDQIRPQDVRVQVDLKNLSAAAGMYAVPAEIKVRGTDRVGISGNYHIRLSLQDRSEELPEEDEPTPEN